MAYNKLSIRERLMSKTRQEGECLVFTGTRHPTGYGAIRKNGKWAKAHRVSYEVHHGEIPPGMVVMHSCDNPPCVNPAHLSLGSHRDNILDMHRKGRTNYPYGAANNKAKLTEEKVADIRRRYERGSKANGARPLAREFGVSHTAIRDVVNNINWKSDE